ncbi:histidine phosphatase family protein [Halomonas sp. ISL-60]|uniref:phosphoglycerate mutase family protein n=1 Tax=Halomonas sp. ISL-56 TaxID=2819149 RepID=UPI001BEAE548|nr:phosphoglycerate mutase family protein [Halomonas sp. ISL-56]MBT2772746.1 histidine phosphatase family protein [Halomonas sp. ISL-60]MBT2800541.1 histidine phosphatase family protein [Halomonas sp. ISL-56]
MHGKIYLIRHGQFYWQIGKDQDFDSSLTSMGELQAKYLSMHLYKLLKGHSVHVSSSSLTRAVQTRDHFVQVHDSVESVFEIPFLKEASFHIGSHDGTNGSKSSSMYQEFYSRVVSGFYDLLSTAESANTLCFTHNGVIKCILRELLKDDKLNIKVRNASITVIDVVGKKISVRVIDDIYDLPYDLMTK